MTLALVKKEESEAPPTSDAPPIVQKAGAVILLGTSHIVLVRPKDRPEWVLPKGHIEENESPTVTAVREALEETGAVLHPIDESNLIATTDRTVEDCEGHLEHEVVRWYAGRAASLLTESITDTMKESPLPRQIGIFPVMAALAKLTHESHRTVLASLFSKGDF
jgi:ADP-ribose pyrophosphatase YjhB (NUDIX family)